MIGRKKKKNKNVLNNIHQLKGREKKRERGKEGRREEANKLPKQPPIQPCPFPGRMTKENPIWGSHEIFKGVFKNNYFKARNHSCRLTGQIK